MQRVRLSGVSVIVIAVVLGSLAAREDLANAGTRDSGIQMTPDAKRILVNKDVSASRYVITQNQDDSSATGNVFFTDDRAPVFLFCSLENGETFFCSGADACPTTGRQSGVQRRPDGKGVLVSKDVAGARYAITSNDDGTLTGNVFFTDGRSPAFLFCTANNDGSYRCSGADQCGNSSCPAFTLIGNVTLPGDFFSLPAGCPSYQNIGEVTLPSGFFRLPNGDTLAVGARQLIGNNPFRSVFTKSQGASAARAVRQSSRASIGLGQGETTCPGGGTSTDICEVQEEDDGSLTTIGTQSRDECTFIQNDGGAVIENGFSRFTTFDFDVCTPAYPYDIAEEFLQEYLPLTFDFVDSDGFLVERQITNLSSFQTITDTCVDRQGNTNTAREVRDENGTDETILYFDDGSEGHFFEVFDHVQQTVEFSEEPTCAATYTNEAGSIQTIDGILGEVYTTTFGGSAGNLQYGLDEGVLQVAGGLTSDCGGASTTFEYQTIDPPTFDPSDPDGCPRSGQIEVASNGTVIGEIIFDAFGGLELRSTRTVPNESTFFANCNDAALLLRCQ